MAILHGDFRSDVLEMDTSIYVATPCDRLPVDARLKVMYLLHGYGDNASAWCRNCGMDRFARDYGFVFVMPEVQHSYYTNMTFGMRYADYLLQELPELAARMFCLPQGRENTFIAGLSMGGFGALKAALTKPERFRACAAFSAVADFKGCMERYKVRDGVNEMQAIAGLDCVVTDENDNYYLADQCAGIPAAQRPSFYFACGLQDTLITCNREVFDYMKQKGFDVEMETWDGRHDFVFWNEALDRALKRFQSM